MKKQVSIILFMIIILFCFITNVSAQENLISTTTKDKVMFIKDDNGKFYYSWSFDKDEYNKEGLEFDLKINFESKYETRINELTGINVKKKYISFNHEGDLPITATIKVGVKDTFSNSDKLYLYHYDSNKNEIKLIDENIKVINGNASFEIDSCSDYFLTLSPLKDVKANTNNNGIIIIGMIIVIVGLVGYTLMRN